MASLPSIKEKHPEHEECINMEIDIEANAPLYESFDFEPTSPSSTFSQSFSPSSEKAHLIYTILSYPAPGTLDIKPTSWLDGVRGVAALGVYVFHTMGCWTGLVPAWHADLTQTNIMQLPLIRTFFVSGGSAVSLFFALSGYVLTHKSLKWIRSGAGHLVYPSVGSSMFRRGFRLYLPPLVLTFTEMLATRVGYALPFNFLFKPEETFWGQFLDWLKEANRLINPFWSLIPAVQGKNSQPKYDAVTWTMPLEFYGSFVCYILLLLLVHIPHNISRMSLISLLALTSMFLLSSWNMSCFLAGMLIADFNIGQDLHGALPSFMPRTKGLAWSAVFMVAFYLAGFPPLSYAEAIKNPKPGFETLFTLIPTWLTFEDPARFWWSISGVGLLLSTSQLPSLKRVFESRTCQYLGKISFSLYLIHVFCVVLFGLSLQSGMLSAVGVRDHEGSFVYWVICAVWYVVFSGLVFVLAGFFERTVDRGSVEFARWLEGRCLEIYKDMR